MLNSFRLLRIALVAQVAILPVCTAQAGDLLPEAFYGNYAGPGYTHGDVDYREKMIRDLEVEIGPEKAGFFVAWTAVLRPASDEKPRRKGSRISFVPSQRPGIYVEQSAGKSDVEGLAWAAINNKTLTVHVLAVQADGSYKIQTYHRTLLKKHMVVQFKSDHNGRINRMISGRLTKVSGEARN
jgi:hypothetical protein